MYFLISLGAIITSAILFCENNNIVVSRVKINKKVKNPIKIVQLSDLHSKEFGKDNKKLLNKVLNENPDLILLTGDKRLRNAAKEELVEVIGTLGILDRLYEFQLITLQEYNECLENLKKQNGKIRLPIMEIETRLNKNNF